MQNKTTVSASQSPGQSGLGSLDMPRVLREGGSSRKLVGSNSIQSVWNMVVGGDTLRNKECDGLNGNGLYGLTYLNTWSPVGGII